MFAGADVRIGNYGLQRNGGLIRGVLWPGTHDHFSSITGAVDPVIIPFVGANAVRHRAQRQGNATLLSPHPFLPGSVCAAWARTNTRQDRVFAYPG